MKTFRVAAFAVGFCLSAAVAASAVRLGPPALVEDLAEAPVQAGSEPFPFPHEGGTDGVGYLSADDGIHGEELWRTDGTAAGTFLVADLCPGACGTDPAPVARIGHRLFFETRVWGENAVRPALWVTDGTRDGTRLLLRGFTAYGVVFRGELWFALGGSLWRSDGTPGGTRPVASVCGEDCASGPFDLTVAGELLFFTAGDPELGVELWASDGTAAGTGLVADVCPGPCTGGPLDLTPFGDRLVFVADDGVHGRELWITDGTAAGTSMVVDLGPGVAEPGPQGLVAFGGGVYWAVHPELPGLPPSPPQLWRTDGTEDGTRPVHGALPDERTTIRLGPVIAGGERLLMTASDGEVLDLRAYDRTTGISQLLAPGFRFLGVVEGGGRIGDKFLFLASRSEKLQGPRTMELWLTDGTPKGTGPIRGFDLAGALVQPVSMAPVGGGEALVFAGPDGLGGHEPWITDGTAAGTRLLEEIRPPRASAEPRELTRHGPWIYFVADGEAGEGALWRAAVSGGRPELVDARRPWGRLVAAGNRLFAVAADRTLVASVEGGGVRILAEPGSLVNEPTAVGERLFFGTEGEGQELWVSDGTEAGTRLVIDLDPGWTDGCQHPFGCELGEETVRPSDLVAVGETLLFVASLSPASDSRVPGLWRSDGSAEGTVPLTEGPTVPLAARPVGDRLVFGVRTSSGRIRLWASDGTPEGTGPLQVAGAGAEGALFGHTLAAGEDILFLAVFAEDGAPDLWTTDGTAAGTRRIGGLESGGEPVTSVGDAVVAAGGRLFFAADHPLLGEELWTSDGTAEGAGPVADLAPGPVSAGPRGLTPFGGGVLFAAAGDGAGHELWASDGTAVGTVRLTDVHAGPGASDPTWITATSEALFFAADDGELGRELWRAPLLEGPPPPPDPPPPAEEPIVSPAFPGFRFWVRITAGDVQRPGAPLAPCLPETVCVAGAVPDRTEVLLRIVGPKPNGRLWPSLIKLTTSRVEVWIEQVATGVRRYYILEEAHSGSGELPGLFDREGFPPG